MRKNKWKKKVKFNKKTEREKIPRQTQFGFIIFFLKKTKLEKIRNKSESKYLKK
jgi:hypothetical protein